MLIIIMALILSACGGSEGEPTLSVEQIQTFAVATYQAQLTMTALALPTATPTPSQTPVQIVTFAEPEGSPTTTATPASSGQLDACYGLSYVKDVTIPDNTKMTPGQSFTKTWLVANTGSCTWEPGFIFNVVGGDPMGGVAVTLNQAVEPGRQYEFSVPMVVPTDETGELKGTWKLSDANNNFFGDGVYVLIEVENGTSSETETPTATPTP
jgi:hypothetical protein